MDEKRKKGASMSEEAFAKWMTERLVRFPETYGAPNKGHGRGDGKVIAITTHRAMGDVKVISAFVSVITELESEIAMFL